MRNYTPEEREEWVALWVYREHIVDLNVTGADKTAVDSHVDKVDNGVNGKRNNNCRFDALIISLYKAKLEEDDRNSSFKKVGEIIEVKGHAENSCICHTIIEDKCYVRAKRPKKEQVAAPFLSCENCVGKKQCVERAKVQGKIFPRAAPRKEIINDSAYSCK